MGGGIFGNATPKTQKGQRKRGIAVTDQTLGATGVLLEMGSMRYIARKRRRDRKIGLQLCVIKMQHSQKYPPSAGVRVFHD